MRLLRTFREMLGLLSRGDFCRKLDEELAIALAALENMPGDSGKAEITLKVVLKYELGRVDIDATYKTKLPETARFMKTPFWIADGALSIEHPNQIDMFPGRTIDGGEGERRSAAE